MHARFAIGVGNGTDAIEDLGSGAPDHISGATGADFALNLRRLQDSPFYGLAAALRFCRYRSQHLAARPRLRCRTNHLAIRNARDVLSCGCSERHHKHLIAEPFYTFSALCAC
jgi:hypothetical protein